MGRWKSEYYVDELVGIEGPSSSEAVIAELAKQQMQDIRPRRR